jgi:PAS domain S-box-containing protein
VPEINSAAHLRQRAANSCRLAKDYDEAGQRPVSDKLPAWSADGTDGADAPDGAEGRHVSLATMPPGPRQRRVAWAVVIVSALAFVAAVPFVRLPLAKIPAFIPSYESALAINDLITAVLLFGAFVRLRSRALLALASGYLFDALIIVPHALSFPGVFAETGLLGAGPQTTAWLYVIWHAGFPLFVLAYALLGGSTDGEARHRRASATAAVAVGAVIALVLALTLLATLGHDLLPELIRGGDYSMLVTKGVSPTIWLLSLAALLALWRRRHSSVLDLWLMVVMCAWLFDIGLSAVIGSSRYDVGWYAGRSYGLLAASFVLVALLLETNGLHIGLAKAKRRTEEHAKQLEARVQERTAKLGGANAALKAGIAEREKGEETLALLAAIVASSDDAIMSKTLDGIITSWNSAAENLFGYPAAEAIGQHVRLIVPPDLWEEEESLNAQTRDGKSIQHFETVRISKNGRRVDISASISPVHDKAGRVVGAAKVARDIKIRKLHEAELARHAEALERSNEELDDFAYIASHDLKEPLRGLFNNARFLLEDYGDKLAEDGVNRLRRLGYLSQRMEQLVNDLLYFARLGRQELAIQPTDLNAVVRDVEMMSETTLTERNVTIVIPRPLPPISCDTTRITEVFRNLISNAAKYNDNELKRIEIGYLPTLTTTRGIEKDVFYVRDNGIGIAEEFHQDIFRIFKRLNLEDDDKKGTGVGLTFVRKIVERHGGRIWLESVPGQGTTFYFTIDLGAAYATAA